MLQTEVATVGADRVTLSDGRELSASVVVDSRGPERFESGAHVAYQKFLGLELELERPHGLERPVLMDARVPQTDGFRFFYILPLGDNRVLVEDTYFSDSATLEREALRTEVLQYAAARGFAPSAIVREEAGVLPLPSRGAPEPRATLPLLGGYQGGWFHPTTGYSFPAAVRLALHVAAHTPDQLFGADWQELVREHARQHRFFLFLNRLLFGAFEPADRWNVLERFYGLPAATIRRFYAMTTTTGDRARILCGRPPRGLSVRAALARGAFA
jgi:lycopene beta-cyclase